MHNHEVVDWDYPRWQLFALDWNYTLHCFDRFSDRLLHPGHSGYEEAYTSLPSSSGPMSILGISRHLLNHNHRRPPHAHLLSPPPHQYHHQHCRRRRISAQSVPSVCCPNEVDEDEDEEDNATSDGQEKFKQSDVYYSFHAAVLKEAEDKPDKGRDGDSNNNNARVVGDGKERGRVQNIKVTQKGIAEKKMKAFEAVREGQEWR